MRISDIQEISTYSSQGEPWWTHVSKRKCVLGELGWISNLQNDFDQDGVTEWYHHWVKQEFTALEKKLSTEQETGLFCHGDKPSFADCLLVPQVYNANRFKCTLSDYPTILRINEECLKIQAFEEAVPENQPDAI